MWACRFRITKITKFLCFFIASANIALREMLKNNIFSTILLCQQCNFNLPKKCDFVDCHRICYVNKEVSFWNFQFSSIISCFSSYHNTFNFIQFMVKLIHGAYKSICVLEKNARIQCKNLKLELNSILSEHSAVSWVLTRTALRFWGLLHSLPPFPQYSGP